MIISDSDLALLQALEQQATQRPWVWDSYSRIFVPTTGEDIFTIAVVKDREEFAGSGDQLRTREARTNAELIPASRNDLPALLEEVRVLRQVAEAAQALVDDEESGVGGLGPDVTMLGPLQQALTAYTTLKEG